MAKSDNLCIRTRISYSKEQINGNVKGFFLKYDPLESRKNTIFKIAQASADFINLTLGLKQK